MRKGESSFVMFAFSSPQERQWDRTGVFLSKFNAIWNPFSVSSPPLPCQFGMHIDVHVPLTIAQGRMESIARAFYSGKKGADDRVSSVLRNPGRSGDDQGSYPITVARRRPMTFTKGLRSRNPSPTVNLICVASTGTWLKAGSTAIQYPTKLSAQV